MAHILSTINREIGVFCVFLCFSLACQKKEVKHYEGEIASLSKKDTIPLVVKAKNVVEKACNPFLIKHLTSSLIRLYFQL